MRVLRVVLLTAVLSLLLAPVAQAAPVGSLKQYRIPTADSHPRAIAIGSDGNLWFTESSELPAAAQIGRITPAGAVTEFPVECNFCILTDIIQGPDNVLYYTSNEDVLGRITTAGTSAPAIQMPDTDVLAGSLAVHGDDVWITDFNNHSLWRYDIPSGQFTQFVPPTPSPPSTSRWTRRASCGSPRPGPTPDRPARPGDRRHHLIARRLSRGRSRSPTDGQVWFTARSPRRPSARLNPADQRGDRVPGRHVGPEGIAASPDGSVWFTPDDQGQHRPITNAGVITESKAVKGSEPFGITVDARRRPLVHDDVGEQDRRAPAPLAG